MMQEESDGQTIIMDGPCDPDAQATVTDFIDYTEYLPSDLVRSLTLIRGLDERYLNATAAVDELTKTYGLLPNLPAESRPDPVTLRRQISEHLSRAINAREASYAEACRMYDAVDGHFDRLGYIKSKLDGMLSTFSADITTTAAHPPEAKDTRKETTSVPKITLRLSRGEVEDSGTQKARNRGVTRADRIRTAAVLDPDTAIASTEASGAEEEPTPSRAATAPKKKPAVKKGQKKPSKATPTALEMSTSYALQTLQPPPEEARLGSEHLPWLRLTDWEMARLRKKMKKNNLWQPSEIMINRELALRGRGWEGYRLAKANAELSGTKVIDCDDITKHYVPGKLIRKTELAAAKEGPAVDETKLSNRGMKLNEAKKLKRENLAREQAAQAAAEAEMAARRLGDIGSTFKSLFSSPTEQTPFNTVQNGFFGSSSSSNANGIPAKDRAKAKPSSKKRKFEETAAETTQQQQVEEQPQPQRESPAAAPKPPAKKLKLSIKPGDQPLGLEAGATTAAASTGKIPAASAGPAVSQQNSPLPSPVEPKKPVSQAVRRASITSKAQPSPTPPVTRSHSRRPSIAGVSAELTARELRKKSATPAASKASAADQAPTGTTRRSKRPAPGPVTAGQDGGAAVSVGRRKAKPTPKKRKEQANRGSSQPLKEDIRIDEDGVVEEIDPNEPRYCICGDVSFGTMICCEDNDCDREWFHLECIGLSDVPSRTAKWYCPECRKKNNISATDGIVRTTGRR